jgi:hypothetical protein
MTGTAASVEEALARAAAVRAEFEATASAEEKAELAFRVSHVGEFLATALVTWEGTKKGRFRFLDKAGAWAEVRAKHEAGTCTTCAGA